MFTSSSHVSIPRSPDVVTILWSRNPLRPRSFRTIVDATVIGSASPCNRFLRSGQHYVDARDCLLANGFRLVSQQRVGSVYGVAVFVRQR
ncbi:hypothetical protein ACQYAD_12215 [Neobacillus sp. SM06]|uniref:hypothetical protein n=1 Tax=Neobacillus sp. SM06 TaxID=3422492 RepID=UPI003D292370